MTTTLFWVAIEIIALYLSKQRDGNDLTISLLPFVAVNYIGWIIFDIFR